MGQGRDKRGAGPRKEEDTYVSGGKQQGLAGDCDPSCLGCARVLSKDKKAAMMVRNSQHRLITKWCWCGMCLPACLPACLLQSGPGAYLDIQVSQGDVWPVRCSSTQHTQAGIEG